eukprot:4211924-Prymnesium_polylepis.1
MGYLWTPRLRPASQQKSLSEAWGWAAAELGPKTAAAAALLCIPGLWGAAQPNESFVLSPAKAL